MDTIRLHYVPAEVIERLIGPYDGTKESIIQRTRKEAKFVKIFTDRANSFRVKGSDYDSFKSASVYNLKDWILNFISSTQWTINNKDVLIRRCKKNIEDIREDGLNLQAAIKFDKTIKAQDRLALILKLTDIREYLDQIETKLTAGDYELYRVEPRPGWEDETFPGASMTQKSIPNYFANLLTAEDLKAATDLIGEITNPPHAAAFVAALAKLRKLDAWDTMSKGSKGLFAKGLKDFFKLSAGEAAVRKQLLQYQDPDKDISRSLKESISALIDHYIEKMLKFSSKPSVTD